MDQETIFKELDAAVENGYELTFWTLNEILDDLEDYCPALEYAVIKDVIPHVKAWLAHKAAGKTTFTEWLDSRDETAKYMAASDEDEGKQYFRDMYHEYLNTDTLEFDGEVIGFAAKNEE